ncbi:alkaline phosphatase family protein [Hanstruepera ponticola]|uniref:hypothetical protein n=1 Tax=Hanstruepera ponticola TaxID=2042995 RepID=UPI000CF13D2D|nr:hypothetical protein [Hanstruepera ponticola]
MSNLRDRIIAFINSDEDKPLIAAIAAGLYPLLYYYNNNLTLLNSSEQIVFFIIYFLIIPIGVFKLMGFLISRVSYFKSIEVYATPVFNLMWFAYLLVLITKGFHIKFMLLALALGFVLGVVLKKHFNKIIALQILMAVLVLIPLMKYIFFDIETPKEWINQPDNIENVEFKKKPNIYIIQPDGYVNFSEIDKGYYNYDNSDFKGYLLNNNFELFDNYRSNYYSTLSSNSSLFAMKHHYYNFPNNKIREVYNARDVIAGDNPVVDILKQNKYKTHLLMEKSYLLTNRPEMQYDYCNIDYNEFTYFSRGFHVTKDVRENLESLFPLENDSHNFFFIEQLLPGHITNSSNPGDVADFERDKYFSKLEMANVWLKDIINFIIDNDPNSLIVITADHGGFVGMHTTIESHEKQTNRDLIYSIFSSQLAIRWSNDTPHFEKEIKTPVNLFRFLFSYLSDNEMYLENLQADKSYIPINRKAAFGVYEYINDKGEITFNRVSKKTAQ